MGLQTRSAGRTARSSTRELLLSENVYQPPKISSPARGWSSSGVALVIECLCTGPPILSHHVYQRCSAYIHRASLPTGILTISDAHHSQLTSNAVDEHAQKRYFLILISQMRGRLLLHQIRYHLYSASPWTKFEPVKCIHWQRLCFRRVRCTDS